MGVLPGSPSRLSSCMLKFKRFFSPSIPWEGRYKKLRRNDFTRRKREPKVHGDLKKKEKGDDIRDFRKEQSD